MKWYLVLLCDSAPLFKIILKVVKMWAASCDSVTCSCGQYILWNFQVLWNCQKIMFVSFWRRAVWLVRFTVLCVFSVQHNNDFAVVLLFTLHNLSWVDILTDKVMCNFNSCSSLTEVGSVLCFFQKWYPSWMNKNLRLSCECFPEHTKLTCLSFCKTSQV